MRNVRVRSVLVRSQSRESTEPTSPVDAPADPTSPIDVDVDAPTEPTSPVNGDSPRGRSRDSSSGRGSGACSRESSTSSRSPSDTGSVCHSASSRESSPCDRGCGVWSGSPKVSVPKKKASRKKALTANGGLTHESSGNPLVDLYFHTIRGITDSALGVLLDAAWNHTSDPREASDSTATHDPIVDMSPLRRARTLVLRCIVHLRDIRNGGKGESQLFLYSMRWLTNKDLSACLKLINDGTIVKHGCCRDLAAIARMEEESGVCGPNMLAVRRAAVHAIVVLLHGDLTGLLSTPRSSSTTLMAKWVPRKGAKLDYNGLHDQICAAFGSYNRLQSTPLKHDGVIIGGSQKEFRQRVMVPLTKHLKVVETLMAANKWGDIYFNDIPSKAIMKYRECLRIHRPAGGSEPSYEKWIADAKVNAHKVEAGHAVKKGDAVIHTSAIHPHEILAPYFEYAGTRSIHDSRCRCSTSQCVCRMETTVVSDRCYDATVEAAWVTMRARLAKKMNGRSCLMVGDMSLSMTVGRSSVVPIHLSIALCCLFAEMAPGRLKGKWLNFSTAPRWQQMHLTRADGSSISLLQRIRQLDTKDWSGSTNLVATFELLLEEIAREYEDTMNSGRSSEEAWVRARALSPEIVCIVSDMQFDMACDNSYTSLQTIQRMFATAEIKMPAIVFWNVNSAEGTPATFDETGVAMISGFSPEILSQVVSCDPSKLQPNTFVESVLCEAEFVHVTWGSGSQRLPVQPPA